MTPVLQVFARAPVPGACKTRLIPALGAEGAATLHARLVRHSLEVAQEWSKSTPDARVELWCAGEPAHPFFAECVRDFGVMLREQTGEGLGARMWLALCGALAAGKLPVLVGTDCPWLTRDDIAESFVRLAQADAVFGPADDGGYVLTGLKRAVPELYAGIPWGSGKVMAATRKAAAQVHVELSELRKLADIDTPQDIKQLAADPQWAHLLEGMAQ
jgi:uncharacterized protein